TGRVRPSGPGAVPGPCAPCGKGATARSREHPSSLYGHPRADGRPAQALERAGTPIRSGSGRRPEWRDERMPIPDRAGSLAILARAELPTEHGTFDALVFTLGDDPREHVALVHG